MTAREQKLEAALRDLIDIHHRTLTGSNLHDPENRPWTDCPCRTCLGVQQVLGVSS